MYSSVAMATYTHLYKNLEFNKIFRLMFVFDTNRAG